MSYLLDTAPFLWMIQGKEDLFPQKIKNILTDTKNQIILSTASLWEIAIKYSIGKLSFKRPPQEILLDLLAELNIEILPILMDHALQVDSLPFYHKDPFDRLLASQAKIENLPLMTPDRVFKKYKIKTLW